MKRFSEKNRVCARVTACVFALMLFVLSACENFVVPALQRPVSKSNAHLTELVAQWTDDSSADPSFGPEHNGGSFTATLHKKQNEERFALYGFDEDLHLIRFTLTLSDPSEEITYETFDRVLYEKSARMDVYVNPFSGMGVIELNMLYRFDTDVYIYVGKHVYTICIQKMVRNNRIYVSKYGDGSGSMDDTTGGELRGYTPDTAFFSLKNAIDRGKLTERYDIYIVGELDNDPEMPAGDAIFVIDNTDGHRFRFWDGGGGSLKSPPDSHKRVMNVQNADVAFIDLDISGGNGVNYGGAMFIEASRAAFLRCDIKDNVAADKGGAVYVADKASWRSSSSVTFSSTTVRDNTRPRPEPFGSATEGIWAGIYTKLTFENAAIHDGVYFNGEPEVGTFVVGGSSYFGKGNSITLDEIIAGDYGAQIWLPNEDAKITLAGNVPSGMDTYGLAAFIDTPAPAGRQVLYEASGNAAHLADVYNRFRINNSMPLTGRVASLRGIDDDGIVIESGEAHVRSDGNDFCDGLTEGSAFKSFEYAVFAANRFVAPRAKVLDMLNGANHRELPAAVGWAASDTTSVFSVGIPQTQSDRTIIIEGTSADSGFDIGAASAKRALLVGAYSNVTLKNLEFEGTTTTAMTQDSGSALSVASNAKVVLGDVVSGSGFGVLNAGTLTVAAGGYAEFGKVTSTSTIKVSDTGTLASSLQVVSGSASIAGNASGSVLGVQGGTLNLGALGTATFGKILIDNSGSAVIEGVVAGGDTELAGSGTLTLKANGRFTSGGTIGTITLAENKRVTIDSGWNAPAANNVEIAPYQWTIGYEVLEGNVTATTSAKFKTRSQAPRDKWGIDTDGALVHTEADTISFGATLNNEAAPAVSGGFYLGADYINISSARTVTGGTNESRALIFAAAADGRENILNSDPYVTASNVVLSMEATSADPVLSGAKGGLYDAATSKKRVIGAVYKYYYNGTDNYLLKFNFNATNTLPTYTKHGGTTLSTAGSGTYKANGETDGYYFFDIKGAGGGNGGGGYTFTDRGVTYYGAYPGSGGSRGAAISGQSLRGNGLAYGIGAKGGDGGNGNGNYVILGSVVVDSGGGGGGGGGGDTWVRNAANKYIIVTGGAGGVGGDIRIAGGGGTGGSGGSCGSGNAIRSGSNGGKGADDHRGHSGGTGGAGGSSPGNGTSLTSDQMLRGRVTTGTGNAAGSNGSIVISAVITASRP
ncbi:MAG: hypothetical protein Ta2A_14810 [Treponemataceae bacterium]|nr:MAG: hypothetical protein Ta2A_14810 [Treponemataceae bacterium]